MNSPDTYMETQQSIAQAIIGRLCDGVEELGARCRQYVTCSAIRMMHCLM
jgi:hypothetical protein